MGKRVSVAAELSALHDGIRLCIALKLPTMEIELDAKVVIDLVTKESNNLNSLDALVADCKKGLKKISNVRLLHCFREANNCANNLARRGAMYPPLEVDLLIRLDAMGTLYDRFVTSVEAF